MRRYLKRWAVLAVVGLFLGDSAPLFAHQGQDRTGKEQGAVARQDRDSAAGKRGGSRWGANYFPNVSLVNQEGNSVRFFDDLI